MIIRIDLNKQEVKQEIQNLLAYHDISKETAEKEVMTYKYYANRVNIEVLFYCIKHYGIISTIRGIK